MLEAHVAHRGLATADADAFVFVTPTGLPLRYDKWRRRVWLPAVKRAGLTGLMFHDLRRANGTAMVLDRVDVKTARTAARAQRPAHDVGDLRNGYDRR